jgi:hypothetical protein
MNFKKWAPAEIKEIFDSLPAYDQKQDISFIDDFGPIKKTDDIVRLPGNVKLHLISTKEDVSKL